jgi:hypothetical protein
MQVFAKVERAMIQSMMMPGPREARIASDRDSVFAAAAT